MNLITAVMVESALDAASTNKQIVKTLEAAQNKHSVHELQDMFRALDRDGSQTLSLEEFLHMPGDIKEHIFDYQHDRFRGYLRCAHRGGR